MKLIVDLKYVVHSALAAVGYHSTPTFLGIGVAKAGTTSLYQYLIAHPDIRHPYEKEVRFFNHRYERGVRWYWSRFPLPIPGKHFITGEVTPSYMFDPNVVVRIAELLPQIKLIVLLRNPVERAWSHYVHYQTRAQRKGDFAADIQRDIERLTREGPNWYLHAESLSDEFLNAFVTRGLYAICLRRWFSYFPRENMLILKSEDFYAHTAERMADVFRFVGVDPARYPLQVGYPNYFPGLYTTDMPADLRDQLRDFYRPHNQDLADLLGWDVSDWDR